MPDKEEPEVVDEVYENVPPESPGRQLENLIRGAMAQIKGMNFSRLARESGVSRGTFYLWFTNQQHPTTWTLGRVAKVLDVPVRDLWDAWEGREAVAPSTEQAILRLIERMDQHDALIAELVDELKVLADGSLASNVVSALSASRTRPPERLRLLEQMREAQRLAEGLSRETTDPRPPARRPKER